MTDETRKTTIVIVTHNAGLAAGMARVVTLRDGKVESDEHRKSAGYREKPGEKAGRQMAMYSAPPGSGLL